MILKGQFFLFLKSLLLSKSQTNSKSVSINGRASLSVLTTLEVHDVERSPNTDLDKADRNKEKEGFAGDYLHTARDVNSPDIFH